MKKQIKNFVGGNGVAVKGDITSSVDLVIGADVTGNISCENEIAITEAATITGNITADAVVVMNGTVAGDIKAKNVVLMADASVTGNIDCESVSIDAGAYFRGRCFTKGEQKEEE